MKSIIDKFSNNPIVRPSDVKPSRPDFEVVCSFNAGATIYQQETLLMLRVAERPVAEKGWIATAEIDPESGQTKVLRFKLDDPLMQEYEARVFTYDGKRYLTTLSHLRLARSKDGRHFSVDPAPTLTGSGLYETFGVEDPRLVWLDGWCYISFSGASEWGVVTCLRRTRDFKTFEKLPVMFAPDNKDIALFPEKIGGRYYTLHRPAVKHIGVMAIWLASSDNLRDWGDHHAIIAPRTGYWDSERVGAGASPIKTAEGWLELYHASDENTRYCTGALLLDLEKPWKVIARSKEPFFVPDQPYETSGFLPNVVFHNGYVEREPGALDLYYGAADELTCGASVKISDILDSLKTCRV
jgi:beta-1,2-mannobiose phosphorylase / 1,2-beta-oligomannan phosphorylase